MSAVPPWKKAILERKKKQEDEEKKKQAEEDAYLSSLPPWKRAMVLRQKEKLGGVAPKRTEDASGSGKPVEKKDSFTKSPVTASSTVSQWKSAAIAPKKVEEPGKPAWQRRTEPNAAPRDEPVVQPTWPKQAESTPSRGDSAAIKTGSQVKPNQPSWKVKRALAGSKPADTQGNDSAVKQNKPRKSSITALPENFTTLSEVTTPMATGGVSLRKTASDRRGSVSEKRRSFEGSDSTTASEEDAKFSAMPAWKKALVMRRRESKDPIIPVAKPSTIEEAHESPLVERKAVAPTYPEVQPMVEPVVEIEETDSPYLSTEPSQPQTVSTKQKNAPKQSAKTSGQRKYAPRKPAPKAPGKKASKSKKKPTPLSTEAAEPSQTQQTQTKTPNDNKSKSTPAKRSQPEIVNRTVNEPQKLVEQEGVTLLPPVYKEVDEWANVSENDPKFSSLPTWKQALIRRRRNDIAKRTGNSVHESPPPSPKESKPSKTSTKAKKSKQGSYTVNASPPSSPTLRPSGQSIVSTAASPPSRRAATYTVNPSPPSSPKKQSSLLFFSRSSPPSSPTDKESFSMPSSDESIPLWKKQLLERKNQGLSSGKQQEKRLMQTSGNASENNTSSSGGSVKALLNQFNKGGTNSESVTPASSSSSSNNSMWGGSSSALVNHNQLEVSAEEDSSDDEDIPFTNIDEVSSDDDDDSGIVKGGTVLLSFKPISNSAQPNSTILPASVPENANMERRRSILSIPSEEGRMKKKTMLRRVSFSDSQLTVEHVYPKYTYDDYVEDDGRQDKDKTDGGSNNSGLSQRIHPSLRSPNDSLTDPYNLTYSSPSPMKPSENKKVGLYTPSILSSFGDLVQPNFSDNYRSPPPSKLSSPPAAALPVVEESPPATPDHYSNLNQDTAALLW